MTITIKYNNYADNCGFKIRKFNDYRLGDMLSWVLAHTATAPAEYEHIIHAIKFDNGNWIDANRLDFQTLLFYFNKYNDYKGEAIAKKSLRAKPQSCNED